MNIFKSGCAASGVGGKPLSYSDAVPLTGSNLKRNEAHMPLSTKIIDGKAVADTLRREVAVKTAELKIQYKSTPSLAVILVGEDPASSVYVRNKQQKTEMAGMRSIVHHLPAATTEARLRHLIDALNNDPEIHGILVQLPLPSHISTAQILNAIDPQKDVDAFHPLNAGRLLHGNADLVPCTPLGCLMLLKSRLESLAGREALVIGRSTIVGKPMAILLLHENCTVTIAHSKSHDLPALCRRADIVIAAAGRPNYVQGSWLREGATVIDVGINRITRPDGSTKLAGDVAFEEALPKVAGITPVPGGVGPMTIAVLLRNCLIAYCLQKGLPFPL